jgi:hypothetical protein
MSPILKLSLAVLLAAAAPLPALAAIDSATVVQGNQTEIPPYSSIDGLVGKWTPADLNALSNANSVKVFDTKNLYQSTDLSMLSDASTRAIGDLKKMHDEIAANTELKAWFDAQKIDLNRVVAITQDGGAVNVYLY